MFDQKCCVVRLRLYWGRVYSIEELYPNVDDMLYSDNNQVVDRKEFRNGFNLAHPHRTMQTSNLGDVVMELIRVEF